jgi:phosphatidylserine/phosphatidylglycerophosphate/cardiolipin synthase-like enzyme
MSIDNLIRMKNEALLAFGVAAVARGDRAGAEATVRVLEGRRTRLAATMAMRLRTATRSRNVSENARATRSVGPSEELGGVRGVRDAEIEPYREQLIRRARHTIWMSSLTPPSARLAEVLIDAARREVRIVLILAVRKITSSKQRKRIAHLEMAGVECRALASTHSKVIVVDDVDVMVGSANADRVHRDYCWTARDRGASYEAIEYLDGLR